MPQSASESVNSITRRPVIWGAWVAAIALHLGVFVALAFVDWPQKPSGKGARTVTFDVTLTQPPPRLEDAAQVAAAVTALPQPVTTAAPDAEKSPPAKAGQAADGKQAQPQKQQKQNQKQAKPHATKAPQSPAEERHVQRKPPVHATSPATPHAQRSTPSAGDLLNQAAARARTSTYGLQPENAGIAALTGAQRAAERRYIDAWTRNVERYGNQFHNGPANLQGTLRIRAVIKRDGQLSSVEVVQSSGHPELDQAALATVREAAPYRPFGDDMGNRQLLIITRTWRFGQGNNFGVQ